MFVVLTLYLYPFPMTNQELLQNGSLMTSINSKSFWKCYYQIDPLPPPPPAPLQLTTFPPPTYYSVITDVNHSTSILNSR